MFSNMEMSSKVKNVIKIHNFVETELKTENEETVKWETVKTALIAILNSKQTGNLSFEELYRIVEELILLNPEKLLNRLSATITNELQLKFDQLITDNFSIERVDKLWKEFSKQALTIRNLFISKNKTVKKVCNDCFLHFILLTPINKKIIYDVLTIIELDRNNMETDLQLLASMIEMFNKLQIYEETFELIYLEACEAFYQREGSVLIKSCSIDEYLIYINRRLIEETGRVNNYMNKSTISPIVRIIYKQLILPYCSQILNRGFDDLINKKKILELKILYSLFRQNNELHSNLLTYFKAYINKRGIIITTNNDKNMIKDLLNLKDDLDEIISLSFNDNSTFHENSKNVFKKFLNRCNTIAAQLLAKYIDNKLRCKSISHDDLEIVSTKVIELFRLIQNKDIFEAFYKKHLAKRLLLSRSTSQDAESFILTKLKYECGDEFTSNMEGMFSDINISKIVNSAFKENSCDNLMNELNVFILTKNYWPNYSVCNVNLPINFTTGQAMFQKFYTENYNGRKLVWQPNLGHCLVKSCFDKGVKLLEISLYQTLVLLLFNNSEVITFKEILELTQINETELKRTLLSLCVGKTHVLIKQSKSKEITMNDRFIFNNNYTNKLYKIRINEIHESSVEDDKATESNVLFHRQYQIDAAIVSIMKRRKTISHNDLISELFKMLDIPISQADLKKRIELLIEREYMKRDNNDRANYVYIA